MGTNIMGAVLSVLYAARNGLMDCEVRHNTASRMLRAVKAMPYRRVIQYDESSNMYIKCDVWHAEPRRTKVSPIPTRL